MFRSKSEKPFPFPIGGFLSSFICVCHVSCTQLVVKNMIFKQIRPNFSFKKDSLYPDCLNTFSLVSFFLHLPCPLHCQCRSSSRLVTCRLIYSINIQLLLKHLMTSSTHLFCTWHVQCLFSRPAILWHGAMCGRQSQWASEKRCRPHASWATSSLPTERPGHSGRLCLIPPVPASPFSVCQHKAYFPQCKSIETHTVHRTAQIYWPLLPIFPVILILIEEPGWCRLAGRGEGFLDWISGHWR